MITKEFLKEKKHIIINAVAVIGFLSLLGYIGFGRVREFLDNMAINNARMGYQRAVEELYSKTEASNCQPLTVTNSQNKQIQIKKADCK